MSGKNLDNPRIWEAFCRALRTEYREAREIRGTSGLVHPIEAIGVDEKNNRIILVSSEASPRIAALMRIDVQSTMPSVRVLVARPLAIDLAHAARVMFFTENGTLDVAKLFAAGTILSQGGDAGKTLWSLLEPEASEIIGNMKKSSLPLRSIVTSIIEQMSVFDWSKVSRPADGDGLVQPATDILTQVSQIDNLSGDRVQGICPIPTYELSENDWELFHENKELEKIEERLKSLDVYQYFFPPADRLALGLVDRGMSTESEIASAFSVAESQGHRIAGNSIVPDATDLHETMVGLREKGYVLEGEFSTELTENGRNIRSTVRIRPSEGLITKLIQIVSIKVNIDLKDIFSGKR